MLQLSYTLKRETGPPKNMPKVRCYLTLEVRVFLDIIIIIVESLMIGSILHASNQNIVELVKSHFQPK